jgi:hypothetical protein
MVTLTQEIQDQGKKHYVFNFAHRGLRRGWFSSYNWAAVRLDGVASDLGPVLVSRSTVFLCIQWWVRWESGGII